MSKEAPIHRGGPARSQNNPLVGQDEPPRASSATLPVDRVSQKDAEYHERLATSPSLANDYPAPFSEEQPTDQDRWARVLRAVSDFVQSEDDDQRYSEDFDPEAPLLSILRLCRIGPYLNSNEIRSLIPALPKIWRIVPRRYVRNITRYGSQAIEHLQLPADLEWAVRDRSTIHTIAELRGFIRREGKWAEAKRKGHSYRWALKNMCFPDVMHPNKRVDALGIIAERLREFDELVQRHTVVKAQSVESEPSIDQMVNNR